ncbi:hypothetical protein ACKKBF_B01485 [Auxenochlorella protothecoides x Auxenochlorella symbiontica]
MMYPDLADHNLICFLGSKMGSMYGGLDHMLAAVQENMAAAANRGLVATSKAGTGRRRGKEPMPVAEPPHGASPDLASISAKPDTQGPESATSPHPVDSGSEAPPLLSIPDTPAPSRESDSGLKEALRRPAIRVNLVAEKGVRAEHDTLYKHLMEDDPPVLPAWPADTIPYERHIKAKTHRIRSHLERDGGKRRQAVSTDKLRPR